LRPTAESFIARLLATVFLGGFLLLASFAQAAQRIPESNMDRLRTAADSAAVLCADRFHFNTDERIRWIEEKGADALSQFLLTRIAGRLAWNGIRVFSSGESGDGAASLTLSVGKASVSYVGAEEPGFSDGTAVRRIMEIKVTAGLARADTVSTDTLRVRLEDLVKRSELEMLERGSLLTGRPEKTRSGLGFRLIGPVLVVGSIGWMVYSFYSIRSH